MSKQADKEIQYHVFVEVLYEPGLLPVMLSQLLCWGFCLLFPLNVFGPCTLQGHHSARLHRANVHMGMRSPQAYHYFSNSRSDPRDPHSREGCT